MKYLSVCSGIEAATVAWHHLGWEPVAFSEIEPFPSAVLQHHYPDVCNFGDMTKLHDWLDMGIFDAPDILCGGTPCQSFSVAGLRKSLDDARGNLSLVFCDLANAIDTHRARDGKEPCIVFWENVPGVLNTKDNAFGCFLAGLAGEDDPLEPPGGRWSDAGYVSGPQRAVAWRTLDAQYFGLAQRRRRVFVVASAREGADPAAVLFEFEGVRRDTAPSREAGKVAPTIPSRSTAGGGLGTDFDCGGGLTHADPIARCVTTGEAKRQDWETCNFVAQSYAIQAGALRTNPSSGPDGVGVQADHAYTLEARAEVQAVCVTGDRTHALTAEGFDASEDHSTDGTTHATGCGSKQGSASVAVAFDTTQITSKQNYSNPKPGDPCHPLAAGSHAPAVATSAQVRRLTPVECARLQGFPDDYLDIIYRGKPAADGPRYKALGNSWAVPVVRWIGKRIQEQLT